MTKVLIAGFFYHKNAEKGTGKKAYIARLKPGLRGAVDREFGNGRTSGNNLRQMFMAAAPGDVFETRVVKWDGAAHVAHTYWFGVGGEREIVPLTRDEAFHSVRSQRVESEAPVGTAMIEHGPRAERMFTDDIYVTEIDDEPEPAPRRIRKPASARIGYGA